jgi:pimeloyl-ACP methyl ester carboxylesterase
LASDHARTLISTEVNISFSVLSSINCAKQDNESNQSREKTMVNLNQTRNAIKGAYAPVNGLNLYYEIQGSGTGSPLILLHGGAGATVMFSEIMPVLAANRQVIAVDLQAHGRTADINRPISYQAMADDIAALIQHLDLGKVDVMGYSLGGGVALQTAIRHPEVVHPEVVHPEVVRKLVVVSAAFKRDGWYPEVQAAMAQSGPESAEAMKPTPMYQVYASLAPRIEDWPVLHTKLGQLLRQDYDWSEEVAALKIPIMIVVGDADSVRTAHAVEFFQLLGGGKGDGGWDRSGVSNARLAILPGVTHYEIFASPALAATVVPFLDAPIS